MIEPLKTVGGNYHIPERRPPDDGGYLFADTAVDLVGRAKFHDEWAGREKTPSQWAEVVDWLAHKAREGVLAAFVQFAGYSRIRAEDWTQIDARVAFRQGKVWRYGKSSWLFFSAASVSALVRRLDNPPRTSAPFNYDMGATRWSLFDAAVWAATGGKETTTAAIAEGDLEVVGCKLIFERLASLDSFGAPQITGLTPALELRQPILPFYLERSHTGWLGAGTGHLVRFYEAADPANPEGSGRVVADFTPKGHLDPTLFELSMLRDDVLALFPRREEGAAKPSGGPRSRQMLTAEEQAAALFFSIMDASPKERTHTKAELGQLARKTWPDISDKALRRARAKAMSDGNGRFAVWGSGGKPTG